MLYYTSHKLFHFFIMMFIFDFDHSSHTEVTIYKMLHNKLLLRDTKFRMTSYLPIWKQFLVGRGI